MTHVITQEAIDENPLPTGWVWSEIGSVAKLIRGVTYKKSDASSSPRPGVVPILRANNIEDRRLTFHDLVYVPAQAVSDEQYVRALDVVIAMSSGSKKLVGKAGQATSNFDGGFGAFCGLVRGSDLLDKRFIGLFFGSEIYRSTISELSSGVNINNLRRQHIEEMPIPLPPLNEQRRIVEKIEELFTKLDAGVRSLEQARAQLKSYRRSVLKAAVEGELSREWREAHGNDVEPASELLGRILRERREKFADKKYKEPVSPETLGLPALPNGWAWMSLDQTLSENMVNGLSVKGSDSPPGVAALKLDAMTANGLNFARVRYLPIDTAKAENLWLREGDFFISRGNGTLSLVGRGSTAQEPPFPTIFPDTMIRARVTDTLRSSAWIPAIWKSPLIRRQIESKAKTTAGIYKVSQADLKSITLPLPPLEEQRFIVEEVERRLSVVDKLGVTVEENLKQANALRQSILKRAFTGELVPQDPQDEPASALLERIRKEPKAAKQNAGQKGAGERRKVQANSQTLKLFPEQGG